MIINKVIQGGTALLDLTEDTVNETNLLRNETAHNSEGEPIVGQMSEGGGTGNYNDLTNKPQINGTTLSGNKTGAQLGLVSASEKGSSNGVASLDSTGRVPSTQLPSYVDDVVEYNSASDFPVTGESGKIYIAKDTNRQYRWGGSAYVEISESLALGESAQTAYRGDRGRTAYDHSQIVNGSNPHNTTADNVILASAMTIGGQTITEVESALNALKDQGGGGGTSNYNDLSNKPQINGNSLSGNKTGSQLGLQNIILSSALTIGGQTVTEVEPALRALNEKSSGVTGVKGNVESTYRTGNVNLTPANIGALATNGDGKDVTVTYTTKDAAANTTEKTNTTTDQPSTVAKLTSGETLATMFGKISAMFKNIRRLWNTVGITAIPSDYGTTLTGVINNFKTTYNKYSTSETWTGEYWIDGKKIYRKSYYLQNVPAGDYTFASGITNLEHMISMNGACKMDSHGDNLIVPLPTSEGTYFISVRFKTNNDIIIHRGAWSDVGFTYLILNLEYTKTA